MKAYMVHDGEPSENAALVFAASSREARAVGFQYNDIGSDGYTTLRAERRSECDHLLQAGRKEPYVEMSLSILREAGWHMDGDFLCASCGLSDMDGAFPVCMDCDQCKECGHDSECQAAKAA